MDPSFFMRPALPAEHIRSPIEQQRSTAINYR
jgi:hypothetical protein